MKNYTHLPKASAVGQSSVSAILKPFFLLIISALTVPQAVAQYNYTQESAANNPLSGVDVGEKSAPTFVDIDNDGDKDCFIGELDLGAISYFKNIGTSTAPNFEVRTGNDNPLNHVGVVASPTGLFGQQSKPTFVDIDNDGDQDCFVGNFQPLTIGLGLQYFKNTGTASSPVFTLQSNGDDPFNGVNFNSVLSPVFVDVDNDGDKDCFIGHSDLVISEGTAVRYYLNTGSNTAPVFILQSGPFNPFSDVNLGFWPNLTFVNYDGNSDQDCLIGNNGGDLRYFRNTGMVAYHTTTVPTLSEQTGSNNPFSSLSGNLGSILAPCFVDINNDGDPDLFMGKDNGTIDFFSAAPVPLPAELLHFTANDQKNQVQLDWQTAIERNVRDFTIEKSSDGKKFTPLSIIKAKGANADYSAVDNRPYRGINYYRLKTNDFGGYSVYSKVESVLFDGKVSGFRIFPSVVISDLQIDGSDLSEIQIVNTVGRIVWQETYSNQQDRFNENVRRLNLSTVPRGIYIVRARDTEGGITTEKILKN